MNSKPFANRYYLLPVALVACLSVALIAWGGQKQAHQQKRTAQDANDTTPKKKSDKKVRDLDEALDDLDRADIKLNVENINRQVQEALKSVDMEKIKVEIDNAVKEVDMAKIEAQVNKSLKEVDLEKIKVDVENATHAIDAEKIDKQVKEALAQVDMEKINLEIKKEMAEVKKIDMTKLDEQMKKLQIEMKDMQPKIEKEMEKAKLEIEKARVEMKEYKGFVDGLENDGLINKKDDYRIEHKNGELIIDGKKQPAAIYEKYRNFLDKHKKFTINKSDDNFDFDNGHEEII